MPSANQLRTTIECQLSQRIPAALTPAAFRSVAYTPVGIEAFDQLLGGLPIGAVSEATGLHGSGRTSLALAAIATATQAGHVAAWVDVCSAFDPESAAANHVLLERLLWVRCQRSGFVANSAFPQATLPTFPTPKTNRVAQGGGSPHPRSEERKLTDAVNALLASPAKHSRDRVTGTPGAPNRSLQQNAASRHRLSMRVEQAGTDRQPSRRGAYVLDQRERFTAPVVLGARAYGTAPDRQQRTQTNKPWHRIDQALRVTDLLLQAGGFSIVVLDLADIAAEFITCIPMATWFRFRAAAEHAQSALLVLTQHSCTGSSAALVLKTHGLGTLENATYFPGLRFSIEVGRQRFASAFTGSLAVRKPPQYISTTEWNARSRWAGVL